MALGRCVALLLLIVVVGFSSMNCLNAVPSTRIRGLMHENPASFQPSINHLHLGTNNEGKYEEKKIEGRMELEVELEDYPGSGANNRHTPRPQFERGCVDC